MRKKELVSWLGHLRRAIDDAYALGVEDAKAYKAKKWLGSDWVAAGALNELRINFRTLRWAYDAGYDEGVRERDDYEARRTLVMRANEGPSNDPHDYLTPDQIDLLARRIRETKEGKVLHLDLDALRAEVDALRNITEESEDE